MTEGTKLTKNNKNVLLTIVGIAIIAGGLFYWFQLRPSQIRSSCYDKSWEAVSERTAEGKKSPSETFDKFYDWCLKSKGLK